MVNFIINLGTFAFGIVLGWLVWKVFHPEGGKPNITFVTIGSFIGVALGTAVVSVLPADSSRFGSYLIGLCLGFFGEIILSSFKDWQRQRNERERKSLEEEYRNISASWEEIDRIVQQKLYRKTRRGEKQARLFLTELVELPYSDVGKFRIMQIYAQKHIDSGVELKQVTRDGAEGYPELYIFLELVLR